MIVRPPVPGLLGDIQQDLGAASLTVELSGSLHGDESRDDFLQKLRDDFRAGEPVSFAADITNASELDRVLIDELELEEVNDSADGFRYRDARVRLATSAMAADEALATSAVRHPVTTKEQIAAAFDGEITYDKGASVLRMFEAALGPEVWRETIRAYLRKHAWGNAAADDLLGFVRERHGAPTEAARNTSGRRIAASAAR